MQTKLSLSALLVVLMSAQSTLVAAQDYPNGYPRDDRNGPRGQIRDRWIDSDALENQAIQRLESALRQLKIEAQYLGSGTVGTRGNPINLMQVINELERSAFSLRDLTRGAPSRRTAGAIEAELRYVHQASVNLMNAIPMLSRRTAGLIDNVLAVVKAIGGLELALQAPRQSVGPGYQDPTPRFPGRYPNILATFCSLDFKNPYGDRMMASGAGLDSGSAMANLYENCNKIGGRSTNWSNAQVCQSKLSEAKCVDTYNTFAQADPTFSRFASCSLNFRNPYGDSFVTNGAGANIAQAMQQLWQSCETIGGRATGWSNADVCKHAIATATAQCRIH